jgi:hypothetical protein
LSVRFAGSWRKRFGNRAGPVAATLLVAGTLLAPAGARAVGSGSFNPTGSMGTPRNTAAAAPLPGGRVLVAGGYNGTRLASAEIFDPATGSFSPTGSMGTPRTGPVAAPLADGRVLVAGGTDTGSVPFLQSAELFDPATGTFSPTGSMGVARLAAAAAPLPGGRVLVAGGVGNTGALKSAEIFDPASGSFTPTGSMSVARFGLAAAPLRDGRVLVVGGETTSTPLASAEIFDPRTNTFSSAGIGSMGTGRLDPAAAPLPDGRVLIAGGSSEIDVRLASAEVFDPATNTFSGAGVGSMGTPRQGPVAAPLADGRVLVAGGVGDTDYLASAEIYAATNTFTFKVQGKQLIVSVQAPGEVKVSDARARLDAQAAKHRRTLSLKPSSASGDPPTITVPLRFTKRANRQLNRKGKLKVKARITFTPQGGVANTLVAKLKIRIRGKRRF